MTRSLTVTFTCPHCDHVVAQTSAPVSTVGEWGGVSIPEPAICPEHGWLNELHVVEDGGLAYDIRLP